MTEEVYDAVPIAEATPLFPPRPDAIVTMLTSDDFLPGAQALLYSVKVCCFFHTCITTEHQLSVSHFHSPQHCNAAIWLVEVTTQEISISS
jgi:hypothetical protein